MYTIHSCNPLATLAIPQEASEMHVPNSCTVWMKNSQSICSPLQDAEACPDVPGNQTRGGENDVANGFPIWVWINTYTYHF